MLSQLITSCENNDEATVAALLAQNPDLRETTPEGSSIFNHVFSDTICKMLIKKAEEQDCFDEIVFRKNNRNRTAFHEAAHYGNLNILALLLDNTATSSFLASRNAKPNDLISYIRNQSIYHPNKWQGIDTICTTFRARFRPEDIEYRISLLTQKEIYDTAFSNQPSGKNATLNKLEKKVTFFNKLDRTPKENAIRTALSRLYVLLQNPDFCVKYLQQLNTLLEEYYQEKNIQLSPIHPSTYSLKAINGTFYPVPNENYDYQAQKKFSALPNVIIRLFKTCGLGSEALKWFGYIPQDLANTMISNGNFITESRSSSAGLLHSKLGHAIQESILILVIYDHKISLEYEDEGKIKTISIQDILTALVENENDELSYWEETFDYRVAEKINFSDTNWLSSMIMSFGNELQIQPLSDYLIDSFCKGLFALSKQYRILFGISFEEFLRDINDCNSEDFQLKLSKKLKNAAKNNDQLKERNFKYEGKGYLVTQKHYAALLETPSIINEYTRQHKRVCEVQSEDKSAEPSLSKRVCL